LHRDVRDVQLAKGAVAGGFYTLLDHAGINATDIEHLYLAGGFGSYVKRESAGEIGLIPKELVDVTCVAGNAAGRGALYTLFSRERSTQYKRIVGNSKYIELSTSPVFQKYFMREMYF
ncbi:MAG: ASKHA domain-containing protein, partial [Spirochaetia bacterium]